MRSRKLPRFMGGNIGPRIEICDTSGLQIPMAPRLHQSNVYIKRKLRVWRPQKYIVLDGAETVLTNVGPQTTPFHGWQFRAMNGNIRYYGPIPIPMAPRLLQSNNSIKRNLPVWRAQKCIVLDGAETVLTNVGPKTTPFHGWHY